MNDIVKSEILQHLEKALVGDKKTAIRDFKNYIGTGYEMLELSSPAQRSLLKKGFSFSDTNYDNQLLVWFWLWEHSGHYEVMNLALYFVTENLNRLKFETAWPVLKNWVQKIENWFHSDALSAIYARLLEQEPEIIYEQYRQWNVSENPWERRQSVVGLLYYTRLRKNKPIFQKMKSLVIPLLDDTHYYVQKAVGWTFREMYNAYPDETLVLVKEHLLGMSSIAFTTAAEKMPFVIKTDLKGIRKKMRTNKPAK